MDLKEFPDGEEGTSEATEPPIVSTDEHAVEKKSIRFYERIARAVSLFSVVIEGLSIVVYLFMGCM